MRATFEGSSSLRAAGAHLARYAARSSPTIAHELEALQTSVTVIADREIRARTPVLTGALQRSTRATAEMDRTALALRVRVQQLALSSDGRPYAQYVIHGTRFMRANDYPSRAWPSIQRSIHDELRAWGIEIRRRVRSVR